MIKITIDNNKYEIPDRILVSQWKKLITFNFEDFNEYPKIIAYLIGAHPNEVAKCSEDSQILAIGFIIQLMNTRREFKVRDFNDIMFGEFVDLDIYVVMGIEKNMEEILKVLTPEEDKPTIWADEAMWIIDRFTQFRVFTYRQYAGLFGLNEQGEPEEESDDSWDAKKIAKGWYRVIIDLADNNIEKIDYVTDQPLKKVLNFMAHRKEKQLEENFKLLQQKRKYDVQRNRK